MSKHDLIDFSSRQPNPDFPHVQDISAQELFEKKDQVFMIDVRRPDEFHGELGHVPGSRLLVLNTLPDHLNELPQDKCVVFICRSGARSARAAAFAFENGYKHVYNMKGGMLLWNALHLEVEN